MQNLHGALTRVAKDQRLTTIADFGNDERGDRTACDGDDSASASATDVGNRASLAARTVRSELQPHKVSTANVSEKWLRPSDEGAGRTDPNLGVRRLAEFGRGISLKLWIAGRKTKQSREE
jgi:hypothetical protein